MTPALQVGIVCDNYKLKKFKCELAKAGFTDYKTFPFTNGTTTIKVQVPEDRVAEISRLCKRVELHFKRSN